MPPISRCRARASASSASGPHIAGACRRNRTTCPDPLARLILAIVLLVLAPLTAWGQGTTIGGHFTASQRLTKDGSPYRVTADLFVDPGVTLSVGPGVVFRFVTGRGLYVDGSLSVEGTETEPVVFTTDGSFTPGAWAGIGFGTGKSKPGDSTAVGAASGSLTWCCVQYAGRPGSFPLPGQPNRTAAVFAYWSSVTANSVTVGSSGGDGFYWFGNAGAPRTLTMSECTVTGSAGDGVSLGSANPADTVAVQGNVFQGNSGYPVRLAATAMGVGISGNTFEGNGSGGVRNGIAVSSGTLSHNVDLLSGLTWYVLGPITVPKPGGVDVTLTIGPGNTFHFPAGGRLEVQGRLAVNGLVDSPVVLTADTAAPAAGFWAGIGFGAGASGNLQHAVLRYAGYPNGFSIPGLAGGLRTATVFAYQADVTLNGVAIRDSGGDGVHWYNGGAGASTHSLQVTGCTIDGSGEDGIDVEADTAIDAVLASDCVMANVGAYAVRAPFRRAPAVGVLGLIGITGGPMDRDASLAATTYHVLAPVTVDADRALTLPAGCTLKFAPDAFLDVNGTLLSNGTPAQPVVLTSTSATPGPGAWGGLGLETGASATLTDTEVRWAGQEGAFFVSGFGSVKSAVLANRATLQGTRLKVSGSGGDGVMYYNSGTIPRGLSLSACESTDNAGDGLRIQRFATGDTATVNGLTASRNGGYGLQSIVSGAGVLLSGIVADGNAKNPVRFPADTLPKLSGAAMSGNLAGDAIALTGGTVPTTVSTPHSLLLEANVTIAAAAALTLSPGASVTGRANAALIVYGSLNVPGTEAQPITFRAEGALPWAGVALMAGATGTLQHVAFFDAGIPGAVTIPPITAAGAALTAYRADVSLSDATFSGGTGDGVLLVNDDTVPHTETLARVTIAGAAKVGVNVYALPGNEALSLSDLMVTGCGGAAVAMPFRSLYALGGVNALTGNAGGNGVVVSGATGGAGTLARDATLPPGTRVLPRNSVAIAPGTTLALPKGTEFRFSSGAGLRVDGTLNADGTPESPVVFTADSGSPVPGFWQSLGFSASAKGTLKHVEMRYAGSQTSMPGYSAMYGSLIATEADVTIDGGLVRDGAGSDVILRGATLKFAATRTTLLSSDGALYVRLVDDAGQGARVLGGAEEMGCDFLGFTTDAVRNTGAATLYARYCFWGMPDGPAPFGGGTGVQGNIDFLPYSSRLVNGPVAALAGPTWTPKAPITLIVTAESPYFTGATLSNGTGETLTTFAAPARNAPFGWDATSVPAGVYHFRLATADRLGRTATAEWSVIVGSGPAHSGDLDATGTVDLVDAVLALRMAAGLDAATSWVAAAADVRPKPGLSGGVGDGFVSLDDAAAITRKAADPEMVWP